MINKKFKYEIEIEAPAHIEENIEELYGKRSCHNPDFPEDAIAREFLEEIISEYIQSRGFMIMKCYSDKNISEAMRDALINLYERRIQETETARKTIKLIETKE